MSDNFKTTHRGVEIVYLEDENKWRYTVNGRERSAVGLAKARANINKALESVQTAKWEPFDAFLYNYDSYERVKVTAIAEGGRWRGAENAWIERDGRRERASTGMLFKASDENAALLADILRMRAEAAALEDAAEAAYKKLVGIDVPSADEEE